MAELDFFKKGWMVMPRLSFPELYPPALLVSLMDKNPEEMYMRHLREQKKASQKQPFIEDAIPEEVKALAMGIAWDTIFKEVSGDQVFLLFQSREAPEGILQMPERKLSIKNMKPFVMMGARGPAGERWLVSKAVFHEGRPFCWCIRVLPVVGESVKIILTRENRYKLEEGYTKVFFEGEEN